MSGNRVSPSQPEKNIEQVQDSPNDQVGKPRYKHAGEQRPKVEPTVKEEPTVKVESRVKVEPTFIRDTTKWILKNIKANACLCNEESDIKNTCHCGKNQEKNVSNVEKLQNKSEKERTNYFGEIAFVNDHKAKYIRVHSNTTKPKTVLKLIKEQWKLEIPALLISVHGSMKSFESLAKACQTSLRKAVDGTGSWIITDGKHEYVNTDETADEQPIIIGISQWGAIQKKDQMDKHQGTRPAEFENTSLDPHHSHFILIDDGSGDTSSTTSKFREELESEITKLESDDGVPIVLLVFQGDDDIKRTVYDIPERNIPVVIVKESDKKASGKEAKSEIPQNISNSKITSICAWNVDSCDSDLGLAILQALSKAAKKKRSEKMDKMTYHMYQLKLADAWNMFGIARNISIDTRKQVGILESCMMAAILEDKVEYVKRILDNDFDLKTFLKPGRLQELYNAKANESLFKEVRKKMPKPTKCEKKNGLWPVKMLEYLLDDSNLQLAKYTKIPKEDNKPTPEKKQDDKPPAKKQSVNKDPCLDLFVWSVLNNRQDMAKLFWRKGKLDHIKAFVHGDHKTREQTTNGIGSEADEAIGLMMDAMAAALFAHALLSAMSNEIDDKDFKEKCEKDSREFTDLAIGILREGYREGGVNRAKKLLIEKQTRWENTSCVLMAVNAKNKKFISDHACQDVFNNIWMDKIDQKTGNLRNNLKLLLCIFCPFLILCLVKFKKEHQTFDDQKTSIGQKTDPQSNQPNQKKKAKGHKPTIWNKIKYFYQAPVVICFHNVISYMIFLGLYSYSLMSKVNRYLSWQEILLCVWAFTIFTQEVIQVCSTPSKDLKSKLQNYIKDGWNILDIFTLVLFLLGMILRIFDNPQVAESALVVHGVNLITFYLRLLHIFSVHRELGPKLVMIMQMVYNIAYFLMILVVFIVAYGIASHSILYPHTEPNFETLTEIFRRPYWNIYGELMLDKIEGSTDCTNDPALYNSGAYSRCPTESGKYFVPLLMGVYMLMCNILLLNLLIAMFSVTFQKVQDNSNLYWSYQQYSLINEYANRPFLAPRLIIFVHIWWLIRHVTSRKVNADEDNAFLQPRQDCKDLREWENKMAETFYKQELEHNSNPVNEAVSPNLEKKIDNIEKQLSVILTKLSEINRGDGC